MNVLWVEDQYDDNRHFMEVLSSRGEQITVAATVEEALRFLQTHSYDLIILDLRVPLGEAESVASLDDTDFNGRYILEFCEDHQLFTGTRIICLTNYSNETEPLVAGKPVTFIRKNSYLREFKEVVYGSEE